MAKCSGSRTARTEFEGASLPDVRLNQRLEALVEAAGSDPAASIPKMMGTESEREAAYRFLANERVTFDAVLQPHIERTKRRSEAAKTVLAVHDTSTFKLEGSRGLELGYLNTGARGFFLHATIGVSNTAQRECFGILRATTLFREAPSKATGKTRSGAQCAAVENRESARWWDHVEAVEAELAGRCDVIHVADCEADSYALLSRLIGAKCRFVTRMARDRRARIKSDEDWSLVSDVASVAEHVAELEVPLAARTSDRPPRTQKRFPARDARFAKLRFSATRVNLKRPPYLQQEPAELEVNVVRVYEVKAPENTEPVEWFLFTTESTSTKDELLAIVDIYRRRWVIEEFFRAVKTGCAYEQRQLEGRHAWLTVLAITLPLAWRLLELRNFARTTPTASATTVLSPTEVEVLKHLHPRKLSATPTVLEALRLVAEMGGHVKNNGDPGWLVLHRGLSRLQPLAEGVELGRRMQSMPTGDLEM